MIDFATLQGLTIPEGVVTQIADASGRVLWMLPVAGGPVILEVEKITANTYAGETTYNNEQFILLDIYPKTNGTVSVTYGGLTKTITDTSGVTSPNAQQVFFGTFNGVSDSVATPASGELTIEGDYYAFGVGKFAKDSKNLVPQCFNFITAIRSFGKVVSIPDNALGDITYYCSLTAMVAIPDSVKSIGRNAFLNCGLTSVVIGKNVSFMGDSAFCELVVGNYTPCLKTVKVLAPIPPEIGTFTNPEGNVLQRPFSYSEGFTIEEIIVPKGCGNAYKTAAGWSLYADKIVEAS